MHRRESRLAVLDRIELDAGAWCYSDLSGSAGFSVPPADAAYVHGVIHGEARIACAGGAQTALAAGDVVILLRGEAHALRTAADAPTSAHPLLRGEPRGDDLPTATFGTPGRTTARILSARLPVSWPDGVSRARAPALLALASAGRQGAAQLVAPDAFARAGIGPGAATLLTRLANLLLIKALHDDRTAQAMLAPVDCDPIADARALIAADPAAAWTVESLARAVGMGRSNFAARFTETVGRAPMEVVAEHRMEHAAQLLREGRLKVAEISELAGYGSEAAFSRRFTRHFGTTPSQMRQASRAAAPSEAPRAVFRSLLGPLGERAGLRAPVSAGPRGDESAPRKGRRAFMVQGEPD